MQKKTGFIAYDWLKLIVALLLILAIFLTWQSAPASEAAAPATTEEIAEAAPTPEAEKSSESDDMDNAETVDTEETADDTESNADVELPPLPEGAAGLEYDAAKGGLIDADGNLIYTLNEDGSGWTPVVPDEMASMQLEGEWTLVDADGNPAYTWDAESQTWVAVPQEEPADEADEEEQASTNIVDCPGAVEPRLEGGQQAEVLRNVNFRSSPSVGNNWIGGFSVGDQVSVMGETSCTPYGNGAYLWWQVERVDGETGWIAEAKANSPDYFLGPVK